MASSLALFSSSVGAGAEPRRSAGFHRQKRAAPPSIVGQRQSRISTVRAASISAQPFVAAAPDDLVSSIISKVKGSDGGVSLTTDGHKEVGDMAIQLQRFCVDEPVKCPLIFGDWDVLYCSRPMSPGGPYRSAVGRFLLKTDEMVQVVEAPDIVRNRVSFNLLGFLDGQVSLNGKLKVLDDKWIQVVFEAPEVRLGSLGFQYGSQSEVKLQITYIDERIRLGIGSRGSLFVFLRRA